MMRKTIALSACALLMFAPFASAAIEEESLSGNSYGETGTSKHESGSVKDKESKKSKESKDSDEKLGTSTKDPEREKEKEESSRDKLDKAKGDKDDTKDTKDKVKDKAKKAKDEVEDKAEEVIKKAQDFGDGPVVAFGDSYFADSASPTTGTGLSGCPQGQGNIPRLIAQKLDRDIKDYSCSGAVAYLDAGQSQTIENQVNMAIDNGDLNEETSLVPISIGGNDGMPQTLVPGEQQASGFINKMDEILPRIKEHAPNADIQLVGYPKMSLPGGKICAPVHVGVHIPLEIPLHLVEQEENIINDFQRTAAEQHNVTFVDLKESTDGYGPCAPDDKRWVSGMFDASIGTTYTMPLHLTEKANQFISDAVVEAHGGPKARSAEEINVEYNMGLGQGAVGSALGQVEGINPQTIEQLSGQAKNMIQNPLK